MTVDVDEIVAVAPAAIPNDCPPADSETAPPAAAFGLPCGHRIGPENHDETG
jgi:hypothetical protein